MLCEEIFKMARSASGMNGSGSGHKSVKSYLLNVKPHNELTDSKSVKSYLLNVKPHNELTDSKFKLQNQFKCK